MRTDERQIDGPDLEREQDLETTPLERQHEGLPPEREDLARRTNGVDGDQLRDVLYLILDGHKDVDLRQLGLPAREEHAIEALFAAVHGRRTDDTFVYAEDRQALLEQSLAVLQPQLTAFLAIGENHHALTSRVTALREQLIDLEDAQEELWPVATTTTTATTSDDDDRTADADDAASAHSANAGPRPSTLSEGGPEVVRKSGRSTLSDSPAVTRVEVPTTLGDADELAAAQRSLPWWRRPSR